MDGCSWRVGSGSATDVCGGSEYRVAGCSHCRGTCTNGLRGRTNGLQGCSMAVRQAGGGFASAGCVIGACRHGCGRAEVPCVGDGTDRLVGLRCPVEPPRFTYCHDGCGVSSGRRRFTSYLAFALLNPLLLSCLHLSSRWLSFFRSVLFLHSLFLLLFCPKC